MKNEMTQGFDDPVKFREEWDKQTEGKLSFCLLVPLFTEFNRIIEALSHFIFHAVCSLQSAEWQRDRYCTAPPARTIAH